jgi:hypothetical protein
MGTERAREHLIDQQARRIFAECVEPWAQPNGHRDGDYAIDYTVELTHTDPDGAQRVIGRDFQVQLKGTKALKGNLSSVYLQFQSEDVAHYLDNKRLPVFLVLIDVTSGNGYWLFVQQHAAESLGANWRTKRTVRVKIPRSQTLQLKGGFREAVERAGQWMQERWPGSPQAALAAEKARLENIDPRLHVQVSAEPGATKATVLPKVGFELGVRVHGSREARDAFAKRMGLGLELDAEQLGVKIDMQGFPIASGKVVTLMRFGSKRDVIISLVRDRAGVQSSIDMPTEFSVGPAGTTGEGRVGNRLMRIGIVLVPDEAVDRQLQVSWSFDVAEWSGKDALGPLQEFERLNRVFGGVEPGDQFLIQLTWQGELMLLARCPPHFVTSILSGAGFVEVVRRIKGLFGGFGTPVPVPKNMSDEETCNLDRIWHLKNGLGLLEEFTSLSVNCIIPLSAAASFAQRDNTRGLLAIPHTNLSFDLWGRSFEVGPAMIEFKEALVRVEGLVLDGDGHTAMGTLRLAEPAVATLRPMTEAERNRCLPRSP